MKLIVGLGNPGKKYAQTRHNIGFRVIAELHQRFGKPLPFGKFDSELAQIQVSATADRVLLLSPLTFMNASGKAVRAAIDFYKIPHEDLLVVCDDFNLDLGRLRFRPDGSAGGQNGLKDIIQKLGTQEFARLRIGVGKPPAEWDAADFVLSKFRPDEAAQLDDVVGRAVDGVLTWIDFGIQEAMNRFNADLNKPKSPKKKPPAQKDTDSPAAETVELPGDESPAD